MGIEEVEKTPFGAALPPFPGKTEQSIKAYVWARTDSHLSSFNNASYAQMGHRAAVRR